MLKKELRLNLKTDFKRVAAGKRLETAHFIFFLLNDNSKSIARVGVAVSKRNFRRAHERNKAKRISFKAIEANLRNLSKGVNLVIMPKSGVATTPVQELIDEIGTLHYLYKHN
jgi:ribonuclease P protein component